MECRIGRHILYWNPARLYHALAGLEILQRARVAQCRHPNLVCYTTGTGICCTCRYRHLEAASRLTHHSHHSSHAWEFCLSVP